MQNFLFNLFVIISNIGGELVMAILSTIIALIILFYHKEEKLVGFLFFNYVSTISIVIILKELIKKPRGIFALVHENSYAFPSGHTAAAMITLLLVFYLSKFIKNKFWKNFSKTLSIIWLLLIISARLYLKVHDIYDILASIIISSTVFYYSLNINIFSKNILKSEFKKVEEVVKIK